MTKANPDVVPQANLDFTNIQRPSMLRDMEISRIHHKDTAHYRRGPQPGLSIPQPMRDYILSHRGPHLRGTDRHSKAGTLESAPVGQVVGGVGRTRRASCRIAL
jgi:hypothetical protein